MKRLSLFAPAKLNLSLDILGKREDGYHLLRMLMQTVSLGDTLEIVRTSEPGIRFSCVNFPLPEGEENIAVIAAKRFLAETGLSAGLEIRLDKKTPSGAGMGGGSADGAAVLWGLNELLETALPPPQLCRIGETIGADVPFCLTGGLALVEGIGERILSLPPLPECWFAVVKPELSIPTGPAFARSDRGEIRRRPDHARLLSDLQAGDWTGLASGLCNVFEEVVELPELADLKRGFLQDGAAAALMTGSGSAVYGLFWEEGPACASMERLRRKGKQVFLCQPVGTGPQILSAE